MNEEYKLPGKGLLTKMKPADRTAEEEQVKKNIEIINQTFKNFNVKAKVVGSTMGSAVTQYEVKPDVGVKLPRITGLNKELTLALAAKSIRIEAPIPGKDLVGIETPNKVVEAVPFVDIVDSAVKSNDILEVTLGKDIVGNIKTARLDKMPHLLVAGATGSGKSVGINVIINSILMKARPDEVKMLLVDPKKVEFAFYRGIPHLLRPVVTDPSQASEALASVVDIMEERYDKLVKMGVRNIEGYNGKVDKLVSQGKSIKRMPHIVVIVDELADLMMVASKDVETSIARIAQKARSAGIHMILATQRPTVDVVTGLIKANVPSRMSFSVASSIDSKVILDTAGAEALLGRGDMLFLPEGETIPTRIQGAYIPDEDVERIVEHIKAQPWVEDDSEEDLDAILNGDDETTSDETSTTVGTTEPEDLTTYDPFDDDEDIVGGTIPTMPTKPKTDEGIKQEDTIPATNNTVKSNNTKKGSKVSMSTVAPMMSPEEGLGQLLEDTDDVTYTGAQGLYRINNSPRGNAYGKKENPEELALSIINDIISQGIPKLDIQPMRDEVFIHIESGRAHHIGMVIVLVFDLKLYQVNANYRKVLMKEDPYKVSVIISSNYSNIMHDIINTTIRYFDLTYANSSNLLMDRNKYYHGNKVKPFINVDPNSKEFMKFAAKVLKDPWHASMKEDWLTVVKSESIDGIVQLTHKKSSVVMDKSEMAVVSDYEYTTLTDSGTINMTRLLDKMPLNNKRYEPGFNKIMDKLVVALNLSYNNGIIPMGTTQLQFNGMYGVPKKWQKIIRTDDLIAVYTRAGLLGLEPIREDNQPYFTIHAGKHTILCSGNGFYVKNTQIGYVKDEQSLADLKAKAKGNALIQQLSLVYDLRRTIQQMEPIRK